MWPNIIHTKYTYQASEPYQIKHSWRINGKKGENWSRQVALKKDNIHDTPRFHFKAFTYLACNSRKIYEQLRVVVTSNN